MAETKAASAANKVDTSGAHDRVAMLSLKADGTPDQTSPEIIGDKDTAVAAAKDQFAQQAVSAADEARRAESRAAEEGERREDPSIAETRKAQESAAKAAESRAERVVSGLHGG
jgi:hypothetical protein